MDDRACGEPRSTADQATVDSSGSPVGVVRLDPALSYAGVGDLLKAYLDDASEAAWQQIRAKIDYTFEHLGLALEPLDAETHFGREVLARVAQRQKLLFKPNLVAPLTINPQTHGPDVGSVTCTDWPFVAALMRWFHDRLGVSYHMMAVGDAATALPQAAGYFTLANPEHRRVTTEAVIEGRWGDYYYGGWGFYFARKYLSEALGPGQSDDPMSGYAESVAGTYLPPGLASDKLMVYDLNRIGDDESKGRIVPVADGANYQSIALHKAIVGGDPANPADREAYPGSVLINVPKLKVHAIALMTNVVKNLGIGLYPMEWARRGGKEWDYAAPRGAVPGMKAGLPHQVWVPEVDEDTGLPRTDADGNVIVRKTGGLSGTMVDIVSAVRDQGIYAVHVVDGVEAINHDHTGGGDRVPEGLVFAGLDPVATDLACARYLFANTPLAEAEQVGLDDGAGGKFAQRVPIARFEGGSIVTSLGYDCPLARDRVLSLAERRGLGRRSYHVVGRDALADRPMVSVRGHLGRLVDGQFSDLVTSALYFAVQKAAWDLQTTSLSYLEAADRLSGSQLRRRFLEAFDEDGDGVVTYEEFGRKGLWSPALHLGAIAGAMRASGAFGQLRGAFLSGALICRYARAESNPDGLSLFEELSWSAACLVALGMSQAPTESPDPFHPGLTWGKGGWPSFELASYVQIGGQIFGTGFPTKVGPGGLYGRAFAYADATKEQGRLAGPIVDSADAEAVSRYIADVASGKAAPLDFALRVPIGYGSVGGWRVPNVEETTDAGMLFTASFRGGTETWPPARPGAEVRASAQQSPSG